MKFQEEYKDYADRFVILTFHDTRAKTFEELDARLAPIERDVWGGRKLPFPILLDATGQTLRNWGVRAYPTMVLIDPEGNIVKGGPGGGLEQLLAEKLKEEQAAKPRSSP